MRALNDSAPEFIAGVVGLSVATVRGLHSQFLREGMACLHDRPGRGGARRRYLDDAQEAAILADFVERSKIGGILSVVEIRQALEQHIGRKVATTTIYRLMARQGWRKLAPRPSHPNRDPAAAEPFKKNSRKSVPPNVPR